MPRGNVSGCHNSKTKHFDLVNGIYGKWYIWYHYCEAGEGCSQIVVLNGIKLTNKSEVSETGQKWQMAERK